MRKLTRKLTGKLGPAAKRALPVILALAAVAMAALSDYSEWGQWPL